MSKSDLLRNRRDDRRCQCSTVVWILDRLNMSLVDAHQLLTLLYVAAQYL